MLNHKSKSQYVNERNIIFFEHQRITYMIMVNDNCNVKNDLRSMKSSSVHEDVFGLPIFLFSDICLILVVQYCDQFEV